MLISNFINEICIEKLRDMVLEAPSILEHPLVHHLNCRLELLEHFTQDLKVVTFSIANTS